MYAGCTVYCWRSEGPHTTSEMQLRSRRVEWSGLFLVRFSHHSLRLFPTSHFFLPLLETPSLCLNFFQVTAGPAFRLYQQQTESQAVYSIFVSFSRKASESWKDSSQRRVEWFGRRPEGAALRKPRPLIGNRSEGGGARSRSFALPARAHYLYYL